MTTDLLSGIDRTTITRNERVEFTAVRKRVFLENFRATGNITQSARAVGINASTTATWRKDDEDFLLAWEEILEERVNELEAMAHLRATAGGSDRMLEFLLKAHNPAKYNPASKLEVTDGSLVILKDLTGNDAPGDPDADPNIDEHGDPIDAEYTEVPDGRSIGREDAETSGAESDDGADRSSD